MYGDVKTANLKLEHVRQCIKCFGNVTVEMMCSDL